MNLPVSADTLLQLTTALGSGLLIGAERGWRERDEAEPDQSAGIRTFALTGFAGGLSVLLSQQMGVAVWVAALATLALLMAIAYVGDLRRTGDQGITSELALLLTFLLGSLAMLDQAMLAAGGAVAVALLLNLKEALHGSLKRLSAQELSGALKLLFISVVLLPALPNIGYGPWGFFNPYTIWWMVVLIAALGFVAYIAIRLTGARYGLMLTAILGSVVSSTAMTLTLSRIPGAALRTLLAAGLLATSALMFPRVLLEVAFVNKALLPELLLPLCGATAVYMAGAVFYWIRANADTQAQADTPLRNPFELGPALRFAALLVAILFLVEAAQRYLGNAGVYLVSILGGLTDVDAITLSLSRSAYQDLDARVATHGIVLAVISNSLIKAVLIGLVGGRQLLGRTLPFILGGLGAALVLMLLQSV